jgi:hypothetical protein
MKRWSGGSRDELHAAGRHLAHLAERGVDELANDSSVLAGAHPSFYRIDARANEWRVI